ncbi:MAG: CSLREA domain-containing protein, partial [Verrucomicrobiota bacterium]
MIKTSTLSLVFLIFLGFCPIASALTGGPDGYGYTFTDSTEPGGPSYEWIDISESGTAVLQSGSSTVNGFGISAPVELVSPFTFYGFTFREAVPSANGYLSFTATEDGTDTTNDCGLIVFPSSGSPDRIYVLHDHLDLGTALDDATIYYQHIVNGPHPHNDCPVSIFQWEDITHDGSAVPFSFQLLLFANGDILMQYDNRNPEDGSGSTTGIQYFNGLEYSCDTANSIPSNHAILFTPPTITVTTAVDENGVSPDTGVSLREAIATAPDGARITFSSALNGATILLEELSDGAGGFDPRELLLNDPMTIDASNLPDGITISGQNQTTPFLVRAACHFDNLTITDGFGDISVFTPNYGGGIDIQYFPNETPSS